MGLICTAVALPFTYILGEVFTVSGEPEFPELQLTWPIKLKVLFVTFKQRWNWAEVKPGKAYVMSAQFIHEGFTKILIELVMQHAGEPAQEWIEERLGCGSGSESDSSHSSKASSNDESHAGSKAGTSVGGSSTAGNHGHGGHGGHISGHAGGGGIPPHSAIEAHFEPTPPANADARRGMGSRGHMGARGGARGRGSIARGADRRDGCGGGRSGPALGPGGAPPPEERAGRSERAVVEHTEPQPDPPRGEKLQGTVGMHSRQREQHGKGATAEARRRRRRAKDEEKKAVKEELKAEKSKSFLLKMALTFVYSAWAVITWIIFVYGAQPTPAHPHACYCHCNPFI